MAMGQSLARRPGRASTWLVIGAAVIVIAVPLAHGLAVIPGGRLQDHAGVLSMLANSPLQLVSPLLAVAIGCSRLQEDLRDRHVANLRMRMPLEGYLRVVFTRAFMLPFVVFAGAMALYGVIAFAIWPLFGDPFIDSGLYFWEGKEQGMPPPPAATYGEFLDIGWPVGVAVYAAVYGLGNAAFALGGALTLLVTTRAALALVVPWAVYFGETILAALVGSPHAGIMYALVPFPMQWVPPLQGAAPVLALLALMAALTAAAWRFRYRLDRLR